MQRQSLMLIAPRSRWLRAEILAALAGALLFSVSLWGDYVYDDYDIVFLDQRMHDPRQWPELWTQSYFKTGVDNLYRPLVSSSYAFQWWIHGDRPWVFHAINLLLHAANCALVVTLARRVLARSTSPVATDSPVPLLAGLLFAVHPVHTEAVVNIVGRAELMCALGALGAVVLLLGPRLTHRRVLAIFGCFLFALLSKEQGMLLPLVMLLAGALLCRFEASERPPIKILLILICFTLAGYIVLRENVLNLKFWWPRGLLDWQQNPLVRPDADTTLMPVVLLGRYLALLVFPHALSADYGGRVIGWQVKFADPYLWIGLATIAMWIATLAFAVIRRQRGLIFLLLGLATFYALVSNAGTLIGTIFGERLMYLPSVFFLILISIPLARMPTRLLVPVAGVLIALGCVRSFSYAVVWNDPTTFYEYTLRHQPRSAQAHKMLLMNRMYHNDLDGALRVGLLFTGLYPDYHDSWLHTARVLMRLGYFDTARRYIDRSEGVKMNASTIFARRELAEFRAAAATRPATQATQVPPPPTTLPAPELRPPNP